MSNRNIAGGVLAVLLLGAVTSGCTGIQGLFSEDFLNATGLVQRSATIPGTAPAVLITMENRTSRVVTMNLSYRLGSDTVESFFATMPPGDSSGQVVNCPVTEITLGDVSNLNEIGAIVRLGGGTENDPFIEVEPFGVLLRNTANYNCGDSVTFTVTPSGDTASGYRIVAFIQRTGD
ncbi:MAG: hypothetical protein CHACPFDD_00532 [Phycisphaerae bacterium]|nr:hypothetical protein [Phycisphaerae bacterium]